MKSCLEGVAPKNMHTQKTPARMRNNGSMGSGLKKIAKDQKKSHVEKIVGAKQINAACKKVLLCQSGFT
jgi:hypothetical protein